MADIGPGLPQKLEGAARQKYVLDYLIDLKLAARKAEADKLDQSPEFAKKLAYYRDKLAMEELLGSVAKAATTEEAERKAYDEAAKAEPPQEEIHARHILLPTEDEAKKALGAGQGRRGLRQGRQRAFQGHRRRRRRSRLVHQGPDGAGVRRRRLQAEEGRDLRSGQEPVRLAHHPGRGHAHQDLPALRAAEGPGRPLRRPEGGERGDRAVARRGEDRDVRRRRQAAAACGRRPERRAGRRRDAPADKPKTP